MCENLREEPGPGEEPESRLERHVEPEQADEPHRRCELEQPEGNRGPAWLVGEIAVIPDVEHQPDGEHQPEELDRPPRTNCEGDDARNGERKRNSYEP